jgi:hypothetical protein
MSDMIFLYGLVGGLIPDAIRIVNNRYNPQLPDYLKSVNFYVGTLLLVGMGGAAAWLLKADSITDALAMGYSAPQIISSLLQQKANVLVSAQPGAPHLPEVADGGAAARGGLMDIPQPKSLTETPPAKGIRNWWGM